MTPERWRQLEALFHKVVDLPAAERKAILDREDSEVRRDVESLLAQDGTLLDHPFERTGHGPESVTFPVVSVGTHLGPYRIETQIGSGGMGRVFRALDVRLNRAVAIKISSESFGERFEREARAIAQLNHPHICTLYDVGPNYLVMELLEGETLSARLKKGPLPMAQVFIYSAQIADALAAAHAKGIVHRDLKPANIMTVKGGVKVLDFGIARAAHDETITSTHMVIGTHAYMSPEQRDGGKCDARSDIFTLGVVMREMATGLREGDLTVTPPHFAHIVARCLETDPEERWQAASDIRKELEWAARAGPVETHTAPGPRSQSLAWVLSSLAFLSLLLAGTALYRQRAPRATGPSEFIVTLNQQLDDSAGMPVPSPDGRFLAFPGEGPNGLKSIWVRPLDSVDARRLSGTEGLASEAIIWSPDSVWIGFYANGKLQKIRASGGPPETIAALPGFQDGAWGPKGDIVFRTSNRVALSRLSVNGGSPQPLTRLNPALTENSHRFPTFLPDGRHFLFVSRCAERANNALYVGSLDSPAIRKIMPAQARVSYIPGAILFYRDGALMAQHFDPDRAEISGAPAPVMTGIAYNAPSIQASYRASNAGDVIVSGSAESTASSLVWYRRNGEQAGRLGPRGQYAQPAFVRTAAGSRLRPPIRNRVIATSGISISHAALPRV